MNLAAFDIETSGTLPEYALQPWRMRQGRAWITSFVGARRAADGRLEIESALVPGEMVGPIRAFLQGCLDRRERVGGWNLAFDIAWLLALDDPDLTRLVFQTRWLDGMLLWRHATIEPEYDTERHKKRSYGLKQAVADRWPEHANYEEDVDYHSTDPANLAKLHDYNVKDTVFSLRLTWHWWTRLEPRQQKAALIEADNLPLIAQANLEGMPVDLLAAVEVARWLDDVAAEKMAALAPHGVTEKIVRSPTQLQTLMYDRWRLPVLKMNTGKKTGKMSRSTDKEVLHELSFMDQRAKDLRAYREALNNKTKFAINIIRSVEYNGDGCTHPLAIPFGTYTGRLTYASKQGRNKDERPIGFALHQEKRDHRFRAALTAPDGYTLVEFDASGQEYRWMAIASGDETMLSLCLPGEDPHAYMGASIAGLDYRWLQANAKTDEHAGAMRQMGKVGNLSCCAAGTLVETARGPVPIERIRPTDAVWDGVEFVSHDGMVYSGTKPVIEYDGLTATPDHLVLVGDRWVPFAQAASAGLRIARGGRAGLEDRQRGAQRLMRDAGTAAVYDILNCGPRNRFVAEGLIVHNCQYRVSANKLLTVARVQYNMPLSPAEAETIHATYQRVYRRVPIYWRKQIASAQRLGYVETFAGRRVQLLDEWTSATEWRMGSTAINYRIQGTGGDQKHLALSVLKPYLVQHGCRFAWDLHDGIYFFVPDNNLEKVINDAQAILNNLPYEKAWGFSPPIPLPWDCKYGKSWGSMKEHKNG